MRELSRGGDRTRNLGDRSEPSPAISKRYDAKFLLEIFLREVAKDREVDPVLGKAI
jgi:hypothetical protein